MQHHIVQATHVEMVPVQVPILTDVIFPEIVQMEVMKSDVFVSFST